MLDTEKMASTKRISELISKLQYYGSRITTKRSPRKKVKDEDSDDHQLRMTFLGLKKIAYSYVESYSMIKNRYNMPGE